MANFGLLDRSSWHRSVTAGLCCITSQYSKQLTCTMAQT